MLFQFKFILEFNYQISNIRFPNNKYLYNNLYNILITLQQLIKFYFDSFKIFITS